MKICCPINLFRLINTAKTLFSISGAHLSNLNPLEVIEKVDTMLDNLYINKYDKCNSLFKLLIKSYLAPKVIIKYHKLNN